MSLFDTLQQNRYFKDLSNDELNRLTAQMQLSKHSDGHIFIEEGERGDTIFLILEGNVAVMRKQNDQQQYLTELGTGDFFGLLSLVDHEPRTATCQAVGDVVVASLNASDYADLTQGYARISLAFQLALGGQLAEDFRSVTTLINDMINEAESTRSQADQDVDVAVIGGGPLGMFYAMWVKRFRPETKIVVLERRTQPIHKVGESTLATTVRAFQAMGLTLPVMRRLFGNKAGLRWFYTDDNEEKALEGHFDIVDIEETYQVERRVLETALQHLMRTREGLDIQTGVQVVTRESQLEGEIKRIACRDQDGNNFNVNAKVVCDASGPASLLPRYFNVYRKAPELHQTMSYNSYFAYFRPKEKLPIDFWDYPATRHICFPEGWLWFISLISWEDNSNEQIQGMVEHLLDHPNPSDEGLPTREELAEQFGASYEPIFSVGFTIRTDRDVDGMSIRERFEHWVEKYPSISWVMEHFELVDAPYEGKRRSHFAFMDMLHDTTQAAGDGWCAIGDSAMFINPFLSLGLNYGTGTAYMAAKDTAAGLDAGDVSQQAFQNYQEYITAMFEQKVRETDMIYRSFNHADSYERVLAVIIANGILDVLPRDGYCDSDPYVFDPLNPKWVALTKEVTDLQRIGEEQGRDPADVAQDVKRIINDYIGMLRETTDLNDVPLSHYTRFYNDAGIRLDAPNTDKGRGDYEATLCSCNLYFDDTLEHCPYCGEPNHKHEPVM